MSCMWILMCLLADSAGRLRICERRTWFDSFPGCMLLIDGVPLLLMFSDALVRLTGSRPFVHVDSHVLDR